MCKNTINIESSSTSIEQLLAPDAYVINARSGMYSATRFGRFKNGMWDESAHAEANDHEVALFWAACKQQDELQEIRQAQFRADREIREKAEAEKLISDLAVMANPKLKKLAEKYYAIKHDSDNYNIGGGLSSEKFASRRHEAARDDAGKLTQGEFAALLKKVTGMAVAECNEIIEYACPCMEWHHAGKLPKSYGGGMKKTYFVNSKEIVKVCIGFDDFAKKVNEAKAAAAAAAAAAKELQARKDAFLKDHGTRFTRQATSPEHSFIEEWECNGKFGWFNASKNVYGMTEYCSGWQFATAELREQYFAIV